MWLSYWLGMIHNHTTSGLYSCIQLGLKKQKTSNIIFIHALLKVCSWMVYTIIIVKYNLYSLRSWWNCCAWVSSRVAVTKREQRSHKGKLICLAPNLHASPLPKRYNTRLLIPPATQAITYAFLNAFFKRKTHAQYQSIVFAEVVLFHTQTRNNKIIFLFTLNDFN